MADAPQISPALESFLRADEADEELSDGEAGVRSDELDLGALDITSTEVTLKGTDP